jgi:hypothetical protein
MAIIWTLELAKRDFQIGYLEGFHVDRVEGGWYIYLKGGPNSGVLVDVRDKKPRLLKSLDSAINVVQEIGFKVESLRP